ncbi:extracellular solute-binding protein [Oceanobacillus piezotolerans]|uniref:Extracellular solute-binding protein n=1 Tax=Oceanobacillus piezotolerans TaxID=2448030 RepID=A0A498DQA9_9BACI|nr:extracellular solute-binding protein [Oceanobacillus piezotolerans]RLL46729.1 extracellular solute-binding protein [Oceanobacillus piezotolerans]
MKQTKLKSLIGAGILSLSIALAGCGTQAEETSTANENDSLETIIEKAKQEGKIASVGMPDTWANWVETWDEMEEQYGITQTDTDMSSAEELAKFESEGKNGTADIGDVGINFGPLAKEKGLTLPYKTTYWDEIPDWAKDDEGHWLLSYTGTIAFITDKQNVEKAPTSWEELANGNYSISVGDVTKATQAQFGVLAAAIANGGDETNIQPGIDYFRQIAEQGRMTSAEANIANLEKGEIDVAIVWDFNGLNYRDQIDPERFEVTIPTDGSVMSGYTTVINKHAPNPNAAKLAREYILSDEGQINLAKGYARPIRDVELPEEVQAKLLPDEAYENVQQVEDHAAWDQTAVELPQLWQQEVLVNAQ